MQHATVTGSPFFSLQLRDRYEGKGTHQSPWLQIKYALPLQACSVCHCLTYIINSAGHSNKSSLGSYIHFFLLSFFLLSRMMIDCAGPKVRRWSLVNGVGFRRRLRGWLAHLPNAELAHFDIPAGPFLWWKSRLDEASPTSVWGLVLRIFHFVQNTVHILLLRVGLHSSEIQ